MVKFSAPVAVTGMIFFGTMCSLLAKLIYSVQGPNLYGQTAPYEKPWFQVLAMFVGMSFCIILDLPKRGPRHQPLPQSHLPSSPTSTSVWIISIPTLFDLFATACGTTGLLYTNVSVYQMLRGAMLVWTAFLSVVFLRRKLSKLNYSGIALCVSGIILVGLANIWSEPSDKSRSDTFFGIMIILVGQILQAAQVVIEEFLLRDLHMSSVRIVAWEGLFGVMHCLIWVFPLLYILPGNDHGHLEDVFDAAYMLSHSWPVAGIILLDMTNMLFYNIFGMEVTDTLSAVHRVVIETLRTLCVWVADLALYYLFSNGTLGEAWTKYSWLQLVGFMLLVAGTLVYNYESLMVDYHSRRRKAAANVIPTKTTEQVVDLKKAVQLDTDAIVKFKPLPTETTPLRLDDEYYEDGEEEQVGSFYGRSVGSVAHSPFLMASTTPRSLPGNLRRRTP